MKERIILHIDTNNAFLSWTATEMLKNGSKVDIRNKYAIIGGNEKERRGIVLAKSNLCKQKGVVTAETIYNARKKCPYLEVYPPNYNIYIKYSNMMYNYLLQYTDIIERYSIDECFLDYTDSQILFGNPIKIAYKIKDDIKNKFGFTVNVGIGNNKLCAKMASDFSKPDKVHTLFNYEVKEKMWPLPIEDLFMVGKSSAKKLKELNINTIKDLAQADEKLLYKYFKNRTPKMINSANGIDNSKVEYEYEDPKSISNSTSLAYNYKIKEDIQKVIKELSTQTGDKLRKNKLYASNVNIWIKYKDFTKISKQEKLPNPINSDIDIYNIAIKLFNKIWNEESIRAICVGVSDLSKSNNIQLNLFNTPKIIKEHKKENENLQKTIDTLNKKYNNIITYANKIKNKKEDNNE